MDKSRNKTSTLRQRKIDIETPRAKILVVDDHDEAATAMAAYLTHEDFDCRVANGGAAAVGIALHWEPHLIVMDISMPEITGVQAALMLRNHAKTKHIAMIAFTALDEREVTRQMVDHEFDGYCQKGNSPAALVVLMKTFLRPVSQASSDPSVRRFSL